MFPLWESLNDGREDDQELSIWHLDSKVLHSTRGSFVVVLIEAADFFINNPTNSTALHASSFCQSGEQLLSKRYHMCNEFNILMKTIFDAFRNEKLTRALDEGRSIKQLYLNNMQLF